MTRQGLKESALCFAVTGAVAGWITGAALLIDQGGIVAGIGGGLMAVPFVVLFFVGAWLFSQ